MYQRKFITIKDQLQEVMESIKEGEKLEIAQAKKTQQIMEDRQEQHDPEEYKQKMDLQVKVLEESDYLDTVIQDRQKDIDQISIIMRDIKDITTDFNMEVDLQGTKLEDLSQNMENTAQNTREAGRQLKQANERSKKNGRCLMIMAGVIILCLILLFVILFATKVI